MSDVKGLTICQPWANFIAWGGKRVENRTWRAGWRGPLVVHAGRSSQWLAQYEAEGHDLDDVPGRHPLPAGEVVAVCNLVACGYRRELIAEFPWLDEHEHAAPGKVWWVLDDVMAIDRPVAWRGRQDVWNANELFARNNEIAETVTSLRAKRPDLVPVDKKPKRQPSLFDRLADTIDRVL